ncbi:hypothetical protein [Desertimonas flava]|uniref:hypothetical protein n=1 Tax=Desertimonas flava TaxID=2064846 RepID=UPI000E351F45|nr:hypothetical protein [Desertimonas flava]
MIVGENPTFGARSIYFSATGSYSVGTMDVNGLSDDERALLSCLPADGSSVTNPRLIAALRWDASEYRPVRDRLLDLGHVTLGPGRGGTVRRVVDAGTDAADDEPVVHATVEIVTARERDLYEPLRKVIATDWARDQRIEPIAVEVADLQGRRDTGGRPRDRTSFSSN